MLFTNAVNVFIKDTHNEKLNLVQQFIKIYLAVSYLFDMLHN